MSGTTLAVSRILSEHADTCSYCSGGVPCNFPDLLDRLVAAEAVCDALDINSEQFDDWDRGDESVDRSRARWREVAGR